MFPDNRDRVSLNQSLFANEGEHCELGDGQSGDRLSSFDPFDINSVSHKSFSSATTAANSTNFSVFEIWTSPTHRSYRTLFLQSILLSFFTAYILSLKWGFISLNNNSSIVSWIFIFLAILDRCMWSGFSSCLLFHYSVDFRPVETAKPVPSFPLTQPIQGTSLRLQSQSNKKNISLWPRTPRSTFILVMLLSFFTLCIPAGFDLYYRLSNSYPSREGIVALSSILSIFLKIALLGMTFVLYRFNPFAREKETQPLKQNENSTVTVTQTNHGYDDDLRYGGQRPCSLCPLIVNILIVIIMLTVVIVILIFPATSVLALTGNFLMSILSFATLPLTALYLICTNSLSTKYVDLNYTFLIIFINYAVAFSCTAWIRFALVFIRQNQTDPGTLTSILSLSFYTFITITMYSTRVVGKAGLSRGATLVVLATWQFYEDTLADLIFITLDPFEGPFFFVSFLCLLKTIIRDLDLPTELAFWIVNKWKLWNQTSNSNGNHNDLKSNINNNNSQFNWRRDFDSVILRHQNFICEMSSKLAVIAVLLLDCIFGDNSKFSPNITPSICNRDQAKLWLNDVEFPSCLPLCDDLLPAIPHPGLDSWAGKACYPYQSPPAQIKFNSGIRWKLVAGLIYLGIIQIIAHFSLLFLLKYLKYKQGKQQQEKNQFHDEQVIMNLNPLQLQEEEERDKSKETINLHQESLHSSTSKKLSPRTVVNFFGQTEDSAPSFHIRSYWSSYNFFVLVTFSSTIRGILLEARSLAYLTFPDNRFIK